MFLDLLGSRVEVVTESESLRSRLRRCFPGPKSLSRGSGGNLRLFLDERVDSPGERACLRVRTIPREAFAEKPFFLPKTMCELTTAINAWAIEHSTEHLVFHAGAVERGGRALLIVGPSGSGKTTLVAGLVGRGFQLLSDEVAVFDKKESRFLTYPRAMFVRTDVVEVLSLCRPSGTLPFSEGEGSIPVSPREAGGEWSTSGGVLALIVFARYDPSSPSRVVSLSPGPAILGMMGASCFPEAVREVGFDRVVDFARKIPCLEVSFDSLSRGLDTIEAAFSEQRSS